LHLAERGVGTLAQPVDVRDVRDAVRAETPRVAWLDCADMSSRFKVLAVVAGVGVVAVVAGGLHTASPPANGSPGSSATAPTAALTADLRAKGSSGGASVTTPVCSIRSRHCLSVVVATTCYFGHCRISRRIVRRTYVRPERVGGMAWSATLLTAPIVARTNRFVTGPRRLTLVLGGTPRRHVGLILSVACFSHMKGGATSDGPLLRVAVPSRTMISLPFASTLGPFGACDISALVTSRQRGPVYATVIRD
jgi:hypothetical protein